MPRPYGSHVCAFQLPSPPKGFVLVISHLAKGWNCCGRALFMWNFQFKGTHTDSFLLLGIEETKPGSGSSLRLLSHTSDIFSVLACRRRSPCLPDAAQLPMAGGPWQLSGQATAQVPLSFPLCRIQSQEFSELQNYPGCRLLQNWRWASSCSWGDMQPLAAGDSIDHPLILLRQGFVTHRHRVCPSW